MTGNFDVNHPLFQNSSLIRAIKAAEIADNAFSAACVSAGFKSRWDVPAAVKSAHPGILAAYDAKVAADLLVAREFEADRLHQAGRTRAGNDISGL